MKTILIQLRPNGGFNLLDFRPGQMVWWKRWLLNILVNQEDFEYVSSANQLWQQVNEISNLRGKNDLRRN